MATHSSTLAWKIPWTEEPGGLQSMGLQTVSDMTERMSAHTHTRLYFTVYAGKRLFLRKLQNPFL